MNYPRFRLRSLMLVVAGAGLLFGLCRGLVSLFGPAGALAALPPPAGVLPPAGALPVRAGVSAVP